MPNSLEVKLNWYFSERQRVHLGKSRISVENEASSTLQPAAERDSPRDARQNYL
jgi:hypothetical protein